MNERLTGLWDWWFWHRQLTGELLDALEDGHLAFSPAGGLPTLSLLCANMADTQRAYVDSLETRTLDLGAPEPSAEATQVDDIRSRFSDLDRQLNDALSAIHGEEVNTLRIQRGEEQIPVFILMSSLVESLLIFHGKLSIYARLAGVALPPSWQRFI